MTEAGVGRPSTGQVDDSVIIALYNGERYIAALLQSLVRQRDAPRFEVLVCDNGSTDHSRAIVARFAGPLALTVVDAQSRRGQAYARNRGADHARGNHLLFLDQDDVVDEAYVAAMARSLAEHDIVAARVDTELLNEAWHGKPRHLAQESRLAEGALAPWGYGGTLGISQAVFTAIGGFDESLPGAGEDIDLCWRAHMIGHDLHFVESAVVHYRFPDSVPALIRQGVTYGRAQRAVNRKHARAGVRRFPAFQAAVRVPYFAVPGCSWLRPRATRGQYAFLLGRYWGLLNSAMGRGASPAVAAGGASVGARADRIQGSTGCRDRGGRARRGTAASRIRRSGRGTLLRAAATASCRSNVLVLGRWRRQPSSGCGGRRAERTSSSPTDRRRCRQSAIALRLTECPFVYRSISDPARWIRNDLHRRVTGLQMRRAARVVAMWPGAEASIRSMYRLPAGRTAVIPNARDPAVFRPPTPAERASARAFLQLDGEHRVAAFIGRLSTEKRVDLAIDAVGCTADNVLVIAGDGPDRALAERRAAMLGPGRVRFVASSTTYSRCCTRPTSC